MHFLSKALLVALAPFGLAAGLVAAQLPQSSSNESKTASLGFSTAHEETAAVMVPSPTAPNVVTVGLVEPLQAEALLPLPQPIELSCDPQVGLPQKQVIPGPTPKPSPETIKEYNQFIERVVDPENVLDLYVGIPKLLVLKAIPKRVQFEDEGKISLLAVTVISPTELSLVGKKAGQAVLNLWFPDPKDATKQRILSYLVRVHPDLEAAALARQQDLLSKDRARKQAAAGAQAYYKQLQLEISKHFPDSLVCLSVIGDTLLVTGQARDSQEEVQILRVLTPGGRGAGSGTTRDSGILITQHGLDQSRALFVPPEVKGPDLPPEGGDKQPAKDSVVASDSETSALTRPFGLRLVNQLRVPGEQQVALKVVVAEVNRTAARSIGVNFSIQNAAGITVFANNTGNISSGGTGAASGSSSLANIQALLNVGKIDLAINALRTLGVARSLAEPTLVALNGQTARFQSGGEFPVPVVTGFTAAGLQGVQFVPFGVQVSFTPAITDRDRIRLAVTADVSVRDAQTGATVNGTSVPGLDTRNFSTTLELREGQTLAVAGLIQSNFGSNGTRVPFFGDLPVVGRLAAFDQTSLGEQELVILVTPVLVHPLSHHELPPLPGFDMFEPSDIEFYLFGRLESRYPADWRSAARTDFERMLLQRGTESRLLIGPSGHSDGKN